MKCPHCSVSISDKMQKVNLGQDIDGDWNVIVRYCYECERYIFHLECSKVIGSGVASLPAFYQDGYLVRPKSVSRASIPKEVPHECSQDYREACLILSESPKASAALSRRCLQTILREKASVKKGDLSDEIQQVIDGGSLPSYIKESIDAVRNIGNFAAHPIKSKSTGAILPVELGEAEWNLDVIELLFDFYFIQPERIKQRRDDLNKKLNDSGKPNMK